MRRAIAFAVILFFALAGCGGTPESAENPSPPSPVSNPDRDSDPGSVVTEPGSGGVPDESDRPATGGGHGQSNGGGGNGGGGSGGGGGGGGGEEDERVIEIGGPTLDNTYPTNPFALPRPNSSSCVIFTNTESDVPVTIHSVRLVDQRPSDDPGLVLGSNPSSYPQCQSGFYPPGLEQMDETCLDAVLEPGRRTGCPLAVASTGDVGTDYTARLVLGLSATCTDRAGEPCSRLGRRGGSDERAPVTVTWTVNRKYTSCLVPRERDGEFSEEEGRGECPAVPDETAAATDEQEADEQEPPPAEDEQDPADPTSESSGGAASDNG